MNILAMETSGPVLTVALGGEGRRIELIVSNGFNHAQSLMPAVTSIFEQSGIKPEDLDLVACSAGPGSFTGLRIGMAAAKGIARGAACHLKAVSTLILLAAGRENWPGIVVPIIDARKKRVYTAAFQNGRRIKADQDIALDKFLDSLAGKSAILATGPNAEIAEGYERVTIDRLGDYGRGSAMIDAARSAYEKDGPDSLDIGPIYLRASEAEIVSASSRAASLRKSSGAGRERQEQ